MRTRAFFKRSWLGRVYRSVTAPATFLSALESASDVLAASLSTGGIIRSTSGNGHSIEFFSATEGSDVSPGELLELAGEMLDLYESCVIDLISAGIPIPSDAQIYAEMKDRLQTITQLGPSTFVGLRVCA